MTQKIQLVEYPHKALTWVCKPVAVFDEALGGELQRMVEVMIQSQGVGLAANQVGLNKAMFVMQTVSGMIMEFINPVLVEYGELKSDLFKEGCLSSKNVYGFTPRYNSIIISYQDRTGEERSIYAIEPRDVVCIQHEMDHLKGIFWWDKLPRNSRRRLLKKYEKSNLNKTTQG